MTMCEVRADSHFGSKFEIATLEINPGDTLVLRTDLVLTRKQVRTVKQAAKRKFPGVRIVILTAGLSLAVVRNKTREAA